MSDLTLAAEFAPATRDDWMALVAKVLKGADFERRMVTTTADGIRIEPLYTRANARSPAPLTGRRQQDGGWDVRQLHAEEDPKAANAAILDDLNGGVSSLVLQIAAPGQTGLPYAEEALATALKDVRLDICQVSLAAGEYVTDAAGSLMALWRRAGIADAACQGAFNADPLGTLAATGALYHPIPRALEIAARLAIDTAGMPGITALAADGRPYHAAGASEAEELATIAATVVAYLRACEVAGLPPAKALAKIAIIFTSDTDQFLSIAKLRAARLIVGKIAAACGAADAAGSVPLTAETAWRMLAKRDPAVNMLRATIACAAAAIGGADSITVLPHTWALGKPDAFARRVARNVQMVLMEESALGRVADPAAGSWYVETLTEELATKAWALFQEIETKGGMGAALTSGFLQDRIASTAAERARRIATGKLDLTGVSAFPQLKEDLGAITPHGPPLAADLNGAKVRALMPARLGAPFEVLRDAADAHAARSAQRPRVFLANLGALADYNVRATWITNFLASGGIEAIGSKGFTETAAVGKAFAESGAPIACLCSNDDTYALLGEAAAMALKGAGARQVLLAGRPKEQEAALKAAGVDRFLFAGQDALEALRALHAALGVKA